MRDAAFAASLRRFPYKIAPTVKVHVKVKEGARERIQVYEGIVIAKKHGGIEVRLPGAFAAIRPRRPGPCRS